MSKIKLAKALIDATGKPDASYACVQALEEDEKERKAEYDRLFTQMREDNAKFIDIVQRELQLQHKQLDLQNKQLEVQNKQLRFLSWAIPVATGGLALLIIVFNAIN